jgi:hypothetical protein
MSSQMYCKAALLRVPSGGVLYDRQPFYYWRIHDNNEGVSQNNKNSNSANIATD